MFWQDVFAQAPLPGGALAIGNFDGVHLGHQEVLRVLAQAADATGAPPAVLVPDPHPMAVIGKSPQLLTPLPERGRLLARFGAGTLLRLPFDAALAAMEPEEFVARILLGVIRPAHVVVGFNFTYGRAARGDANTLRAQLAASDVRLDIVPPTQLAGDTVSSSRVRAALAQGDLPLVRAMLGRDFALRGEVREGARRGRTMGFPTANVHCPAEQAMPGPGVYAVRSLVNGRVVAGAASLGPRPTFDEEAPLLEVHLLDFSGDLYGQELAVSFAARLRDIERFDSVEALRITIEKDCQDARKVLGVAADFGDMLG
ncbi:MAG: bifunctional riboflavin kinase/FAD synthetase [Thermaerobacter sp.]|nr:bifunctional riboflavin kinase/FAD synthetase [Thermaerobacter sp.]